MRLARIVVVAVAVLVATTAAASAHDPFTEPGTMYVEFLLPPQPLEEVDAFFNDNFGLFADGERCFPFTFNEMGWSDYGDHVGQTVVLGRESQPSACRQEGAQITFGDGADRWLAMITTFQPNMQATINDYTTSPPGVGGPAVTVAAPLEPLTPPPPPDFPLPPPHDPAASAGTPPPYDPGALPNTGSGGLADESGGTAWVSWAATAVLALLTGVRLTQVRRR